MLKQRVITAVVLLVLILSVLFAMPKMAFQYLLISFFALAAWEWADLSGFSKSFQRIGFAVLVAAALVYLVNFLGFQTAFNTSPYKDAIKDITHAGALFWALALLWVKGYPTSASIWGARPVRLLMGVFVLLPSALALMYVQGLNGGSWLFLYIVAIVASADIGAYFSGRKFGKKKLAPAVSPGKSWAGFFGGLVSVAVLALVIGSFYSVSSLSLPQLLLVSVATALASVLGDLLESMVKRHRGVKDSSLLLPGHGGVMDRIDSLTAAAPVFVLLLLVF